MILAPCIWFLLEDPRSEEVLNMDVGMFLEKYGESGESLQTFFCNS